MFKKSLFIFLGITTFAFFVQHSPVFAQQENQLTQLLPSSIATSSTVESVPLSSTSSENTAAVSTTNNSISLTTIPPRLGDDYSINIAPGQQKTVTIEVRNNSPQSVQVLSLAQDFILGGEDGTTPIPVNDPSLSGKWSMANWISLGNTNYTLESKASLQIPVQISVPVDAEPGGHYAAILHRPISGQKLDTTGSRINPQIGNLLYVIVDGPMQENLEITNFTFDNFHERGPVNYQFAVENDSSYHLSPSGQINIKNMFGQNVAQINLSSNKNIFPGTVRQYAGTWDTGWGLGPYQATLTLNYGQDSTQTQATTSFWILPVRIIVLIVLLIILAIVVVSGLHNKKKKAALKAAAEAKLNAEAETISNQRAEENNEKINKNEDLDVSAESRLDGSQSDNPGI